MWLLNAAIFFALFAFSLNNQEPVTLHLFFGVQWQAPLVLVLLVFFGIGIAGGVMASLGIMVRQRREIRRLRREAGSAAPEAALPAAESSYLGLQSGAARHGN